MPKRITRSRQRGWRMPEGAVYVGRPTRWGNPAAVGQWVSIGSAWRKGKRCTVSTVLRTRADAVWYYRQGLFYGGFVTRDHLGVTLATPLPSVEEVRADLAGADLACWCPLDQPCHADVLLRIANPDTPSSTDTEGA